MIFDGKKFAAEMETQLKEQVSRLPKKLKLAVLSDETNMGSVTYTNLKEKFAQRIGVDFQRIKSLDEARDADGMIIQLPYPNSEKLIKQIDPVKDVDGLRDDSPFMPAAVRAVSAILNEVKDPGLDSSPSAQNDEIVIVGSHGFVGRKLMKYFPEAIGIDKNDFNLEILKSADVIISATGQGNLVKPDMVKEGVVAIDLGYPMGDFEPSVAFKASFFTPVPGGVGPVTVACLFANLVGDGR